MQHGGGEWNKQDQNLEILPSLKQIQHTLSNYYASSGPHSGYEETYEEVCYIMRISKMSCDGNLYFWNTQSAYAFHGHYMVE